MRPVFLAIAPINAGGIAIIIHPMPAMNDNFCAPDDVFVDKTR